MSKKLLLLALLTPFFIFQPRAIAQKFQLGGIVIDKSTGEPLPSATIQVKDTYTGTITNLDGLFSLEVSKLPSILIVRYIGYRILEYEVTNADQDITLKLIPAPVEIDEVTISEEDPAVYIMREVIKMKKTWRSQLRSYDVEAYTRQLIENDSGIVSITESVSQVYWDIKQGSKEVIKSRRQTKNVEMSQNFAGASYIPNLYDDDIDISGFNMIGVTHPYAISYYAFKLTGLRQLGDERVFDISVKPKSTLQPLFEGTISILDNSFALIDVDLVPGDAVIFPPPIREFGLHYKQQFRNFDKDFWLPVDMRIEGIIKIGFVGFKIPRIIFNQVSRLSDYNVNVTVPDSLFSLRQRLLVDSLSLGNDTLFTSKQYVIPLTTREQGAYNELDSTQTLDKAFKPTGALAKFADNDENNSGFFNSEVFKYFLPYAHFNRVQGGYLEAILRYNELENWKFSTAFGYSLEPKEIEYHFETEYLFKKHSTFTLYHGNHTESRYQSEFYNRLVASIPTLLGQIDYFDFIKNRRTELSYLFKKRRSDFSANFSLSNNYITSLSKQTDFDFIGRQFYQRINPLTDQGNFNEIKVGVIIGDEPIPISPVGQKSLVINLLHSNKLYGSDANYTQLEGSLTYRFNTFLKRRFMPNVLDLKLIGGHSFGDLPNFRHTIINSQLSGFTPFGTIKTMNNSVYEGESVLGLFWEHNFRTVPFELLGLDAVAKKGTGIIIFGGHAKSWLSQHKKQQFFDMGLPYNYHSSNAVHHEIGVSINSLFDLFRVDFAYRLDRPLFYGGISIARLF